MSDITGSMTNLIGQVKNEIKQTVKAFQATLGRQGRAGNQGRAVLEVAFVGYRDVDYPLHEQLVVMDFTEDIDSFIAKVQNIPVIGGEW
jgi:hypothetical protein